MFRRQFSQKATIQEGDVVLLRKKKPPIFRPILTSPLRKDRIIRGKSNIDLRGTITEASIIGKGIRDIITSTKGDEYRIHEPSLGDYVTLSPRLVTPIYPASAALMVDLLDLHPTTYREGDNEPSLEIFEAGTGHGSLTLHLSRAIHGANSRPPVLPPLSVLKKLRSYRKERPAAPLKHDDNQAAQMSVLATALESAAFEHKPSSGSSVNSSSQSAESSTGDSENHVESVQDVKAESVKWLQSSHDLITEYEKHLQFTHEMKVEYEQWLKTRRAIVQTLDISSQHSEHAEQIIRSYRQGIYYPNINFHVGSIPEYLSERLKKEPEPFLQHVILDLPETHKYLDLIAKALKPNGILLLFCPSVTQIIPGIQRVKNERLPFHLEKVLEIGDSKIGGRPWDLKLVKTRKQLKEEARTKEAEKQYGFDGDSSAVEVDQEVVGEVPVEAESNGTGDDWNTICHPEPGGRVDAGAFIAIWRRMEQTREYDP